MNRALAFLLASLVLIAATPSHATGKHHTPAPPPKAAPATSADSHSESAATALGVGVGVSKSSSNAAGGAAKASQAQHQGQVATGGNAEGGASSAVSEGSEANSGGNTLSTSSVYEEKRQAAMASAGGTNTTADCTVSQGFGVSSVVGGVSFGRGKKDRDCRRYQLAMDLYARGQTAAGDRVYCTITEIKDALGEDCLALVHQLPDVRLRKREEFEKGVNK